MSRWRWNSRLPLSLHRCLSKRARVSSGWDVVFNPKTSKHQCLEIFRQKLSDSIDGNVNPTSNPQMMASLNFLLRRASISEQNFKKSLMALYKLILQRRIPEDEIYSAILQASDDRLVNLTVPHEIDTAQQGHQRPSLQIHPGKGEHLGKVLRSIRNNEDEQNRQLTKGELFQDPGELREAAVQSHINLQSLQEYLNKAEQGKKQKKYAWEEQRRYTWDHFTNDSPKMSAGRLFFGHETKPARRSISKVIQRLWRTTSVTGSIHGTSSSKEPKDLLIYNLDRHSKVLIPAAHSNSVFNINYRDLFGVINSSGRAPQETLDAINALEADGWKLIGDLYDNSENVVFQRSANSPGRKKRNNLSTSAAASIVALLMVLGYYNYKSSEPTKDSQKNHEHL